MTELFYAHHNQTVIDALLTRKSGSANHMAGPCPSDDVINTILKAAMRVPDHNKLNPWWFIVFKGDDRAAFGEIIRQAWLKREPQATAEKLEAEANRFMRAPLVIAVISSPRESLIPVWEQMLSAGAACYNLSLATIASGYGVKWLTEWYAYDDTIRAALKLSDHERIAGFIYIGAPTDTPQERPRPEPETLVNYDFRNALNRGHEYAKTGVGYNMTGLDK
jgi:nitroreductase